MDTDMWKKWREGMAASELTARKKQLEATVECVDRVQNTLNSSRSWALPTADASLLPRESSSSRIRDAPPGLEQQFQELYSLLRPCLVERQRKSNVSALLMGLRGSGKTLLLERCLETFQRETNGHCGRIVRLNGIATRGEDVGSVVNEIVRQLSELAVAETRQGSVGVNDDDYDDVTQERERERKRARLEEADVSKLLRLRKSSFTSNLALLDEALKLACVDSIPILVVLDEMDAFVGSDASAIDGMMASESAASTDRQLLLYHLLDRVATQGSFLSVVGITSHLSAVGTFEKRVKSRAEGTSKVIYVKPNTSFQKMVEIILSKLHRDTEAFDETTTNRTSESLSIQLQAERLLKKSILDLLIPPTDDAIVPDTNAKAVRMTLEHQYRLGMNIRWFCRVLSVSLSLYSEECAKMLRKIQAEEYKVICPSCPSLEPDHFSRGLAIMGVVVDHDDEVDSDTRARMATPRRQALHDLAGPQLAVVFSARRILARDAHQEEISKPLTMERIFSEYQSYRSSSNRYHRNLLLRSFMDLLAMDILKPSSDHSGGGPLQYEFGRPYAGMDTATMCRMPLHFPMEIDRELGEALKGDLLDCSTALREWAKKIT